MYLAPLALADSVLTEAEKRGGCVLVDLGADTTTISVYYKNILRHLAVLPLGSANITKDIASLQLEEKDAEAMKLKYASAFTDNNEIDNNLSYPLDADRTIESRKFIEIVEARVEEIIENVIYQIPPEFIDKLLGGFILTGGDSNLRNIERAFRNHTHVNKIRIAQFVSHTITSGDADINAKNGTMNTILGLLAKGDMNCAGAEINPDKSLFEENKTTTSSTTDIHQTPRKPTEIGQGVVLTAAEKEKAEAERRRLEEEERKRREEEEERIRQEEEEKRKNSFWGKLSRKIKDFSGSILEPED